MAVDRTMYFELASEGTPYSHYNLPAAPTRKRPSGFFTGQLSSDSAKKFRDFTHLRVQSEPPFFAKL